MDQRVSAPGGKLLPIGGPRQAKRPISKLPCRARWHCIAAEEVPRRGIPHLNRFLLLDRTRVARRRGDAGSVWCPRHGPERTCLPPIGQEGMTTPRVSHLDGAIQARRRDLGSIG